MAVIYGSVRKSYLQMLNQGLRLALETFRTFPIASLYVESDEPSLHIFTQRETYSSICYIRLAANPSTPTHEVSFPPTYAYLYEKKTKSIKAFGLSFATIGIFKYQTTKY